MTNLNCYFFVVFKVSYDFHIQVKSTGQCVFMHHKSIYFAAYYYPIMFCNVLPQYNVAFGWNKVAWATSFKSQRNVAVMLL